MITQEQLSRALSHQRGKQVNLAVALVELGFAQEEIAARGHSIECRINAEDPDTLTPSPGRITHLALPGGPGVRVDTHLYSGYMVPPHYDSLIAKLLVYGRDREEALVRGRRALEMLRIEGRPLRYGQSAFLVRYLLDGSGAAGRAGFHRFLRHHHGMFLQRSDQKELL